MMASLSSLTPLEPATPLPPSMAASALLRALPLLRHRLQLHRQRLAAAAASVFSAARVSPPPRRWPLCTAAGDSVAPEETAAATATEEAGVRESPKYQRWNDPDYRQWKDKEEEILRDIEPILLLTKDILHSRTYMDGERLKAEDEKAIVEKLLVYHPHAEDKVGCGLDSIMVDRHPQFMQSRCLFLIRTDGAWVDFSYQKCLRQYIREKYPSHAERFIREHFKRSSG